MSAALVRASVRLPRRGGKGGRGGKGRLAERDRKRERENSKMNVLWVCITLQEISLLILSAWAINHGK